MILADLLYLFNIVELLYLEPVSIYIASSLLGLAAPIIWTAPVDFIFLYFFFSLSFLYLQETFLASNSDPSTITRNSGVFWTMNMSSSFMGNTLAFFLFKKRVMAKTNKLKSDFNRWTPPGEPAFCHHSTSLRISLNQTNWGGVYSTCLGFTSA